MPTQGRGFRGRSGLAVMTAAVWGMTAITSMASEQGRGKSATAPPQAGWLYVVASDYKTQQGRILVVDAQAGRVVRTLSKGYHPDLAVSRDGARLFLSYANRDRPGGAFEVLDAVSGAAVLHLEENEAWTGRPGPYSSRMALSRDGTLLFRFRDRLTVKNGAEYWIETFDTVNNIVLPRKTPVSLCGQQALLIPGETRETVYVGCPESQDFRVLTIDPRGAPAEPDTPRLPFSGRGNKANRSPVSLLTAVASQAQRALIAVRPDGSFFKYDMPTSSLLESDAVDRLDRGAPLPDQRTLAGDPRHTRSDSTDWFGRARWPQQGVLSRDESRLYLLLQSEVAVLDLPTLTRTRTVPLDRPYSSLTAGGGAEFYAIDYVTGSVAVVDTASGRTLRVISDVGPSPVFAIAATP